MLALRRQIVPQTQSAFVLHALLRHKAPTARSIELAAKAVNMLRADTNRSGRWPSVGMDSTYPGPRHRLAWRRAFGALLSRLAIRASGYSLVALGTFTYSFPALTQDARQPLTAQATTTVRIRLLNAKTGQPIAGKQIFFDRQARLLTHIEDEDIVTGADGTATAIVPTTGYMIDPVVVDLHMCSKGEKKDEGRDHVSRFPIAQIVASGLVARNSCGNITQTAQPGEFVLWARPKSALEKLTD